MPASGAPVLGRRALGRATLAPQLLLERTARAVAEALEHLVGLQAQVPQVPHLALWDRLVGYDPAELDGLMTSRGWSAPSSCVPRSTR